MKKEYKYSEMTDKIIEIFYRVYRELGYGFLESVYQNALYYELKNSGFEVESKKSIEVYYKSQLVGKYVADLIVNDKIILELKAADFLLEEHEFQLVNYLRATEIEVGLLLNFGKKPELKRKAFDNKRKNLRQSAREASASSAF